MTATYYGKFKSGNEHPGYGELRPEIHRAKTILMRMMPHYFNANVKKVKRVKGFKYEAYGTKYRDTASSRKYIGLFDTHEDAVTACRKEKNRLIKALMDFIDIHESGQPNMMSIDSIINPTK